MVGLSVMQIANQRGIKTINIIRDRPDYASVVEKMKSYGGYIVCTDEYMRTPEFRRLISDLPKPKLALNGLGGPTVAEMMRVLEYVLPPIFCIIPYFNNLFSFSITAIMLHW